MTRVAIMQPTYLPWSGYFGLMNDVDIFIYLDSVQFSRRSWQQRNQIKTSNGPTWLSIPVLKKGKRDQLIHEVEIDHSASFSESHVRSMVLNYKKSIFFDDYSGGIFSRIRNTNSSLCEYNIEIIKYISDILEIKTKTIRSSELNSSGKKADLLAAICQEVGATEYISVPGSSDYLDKSDAFIDAGIPVSYFNYIHPEYPQLFGEFLPYMSVIDMLFNCGSQSSTIIQNGIIRNK